MLLLLSIVCCGLFGNEIMCDIAKKNLGKAIQRESLLLDRRIFTYSEYERVSLESIKEVENVLIECNLTQDGKQTMDDLRMKLIDGRSRILEAIRK